MKRDEELLKTRRGRTERLCYLCGAHADEIMKPDGTVDSSMIVWGSG